MPSYWLTPQTDDNSSLGLDTRPWYRNYALSETFYGLIGGGTSALFDNFPGVFEQACRIARVEFADIFPLYISSKFNDPQEVRRKAIHIQKDLPLVQRRFSALYNNLGAIAGWENMLIIPTTGYNPDRAYFANITADHVLKERDAFEDWEEEDFLSPDNIDTSFGRDLRFVLSFISLAMETGNSHFWLLGR